MGKMPSDNERQYFQEQLARIAYRVDPPINEMCPRLDFPVELEGPWGIPKTIEYYLREFFETAGRITIRNGRYVQNKLPVGICYGFYWPESWENPPAFKIQVAREKKRARKELLGLPGIASLTCWQTFGVEQEGDWAILETSTSNFPPEATEDIASWVFDRFVDLRQAGVLKWIEDNAQP